MIRVAVTTAVDRAPEQGRAVSEHGMEAVFLPCIEIIHAGEAALAEARLAAASADWLLFTSPRAVGALWPGGGMPAVPAAAVGTATAAAVERAGGKVGMVGDSGAAALVRALAAPARGMSVVFPHAAGADPATALALEKSGALVKGLPVYQTRPTAPGPDPVDVVVLASPSAIDGWLRSRTLDDLLVAVIGKTTSAALTRAGRLADMTAPHPDFESLAGVIAAYPVTRSVP